MENKQFTVLTDSPDCKEDWLESRFSAEQITELIQRSAQNSPFTIGIDGSWGTGKSCLMLMIQDELTKQSVISVWFNAWMHQHKRNPAEGLIKSILVALKGGLGRRRGGSLYLYLLFSRRIAITLFKVLLHAVFGWLKVTNSVVDDIWRDFEKDVELANTFKDKLSDVITKFIRKNKLLVVFIDDLDRCDPHAIIKIFEAIKVYLESKGMVFILGYDRSALVDAVKNRLISEHAQLAVNYLEKIVQIPYQVPIPTNDQIMNFLIKCLEKSNTENVFAEDVRPTIIEFSEKNPRRIKRLINTFALAHSLGLIAGDVNYQVRLLLLWLYYRPLHTIFLRSLDDAVRFKNYSEVRETLDVKDVKTLTKLQRDKLLEFVPLSSGEPPTREDILQRLDRAVPSPFAEFYKNESVRSLVDWLANTWLEADTNKRQSLQKQSEAQVERLERETQLFEPIIERELIALPKPAPIERRKVTGSELHKIIRDRFPEGDINFLDPWPEAHYSLCDIEDIEVLLNVDETNHYQYVRHKFDCDDFAKRLWEQFSTPDWKHFAIGLFFSDIHAMVICVDANEDIWLIEPQTDERRSDLLDWQGTRMRSTII